jgi:hypothetical protein
MNKHLNDFQENSNEDLNLNKTFQNMTEAFNKDIEIMGEKSKLIF